MPFYARRLRQNGTMTMTNNKKALSPSLQDFIRSVASDLDARNADKETPVHLAAAAGRVNIVEALTKAGGDVRVRNDLGETILDRALARKRTALLEILHKNGYEESEIQDRD